MIKVEVQLVKSSQPIIYKNVINTYQKGDLYVVYTAEEKSYKHPINSIWRIIEEYGYHGRILHDASTLPEPMKRVKG